MTTSSRVILPIASVTVSSALSAMSWHRVWLRWSSVDPVLIPLSRDYLNNHADCVLERIVNLPTTLSSLPSSEDTKYKSTISPARIV